MSLVSTLTSATGLRRVLGLDALSGAAIGGLQLAFTAVLSESFGLSQTLLLGTGIAIFAFVALAGWLALQAPPARGALALLAAGNFAWAAGCLLLAFGAAPAITPLGTAYLLVQAVAVLAMAELQWMALRRSRGALAA